MKRIDIDKLEIKMRSEALNLMNPKEFNSLEFDLRSIRKQFDDCSKSFLEGLVIGIYGTHLNAMARRIMSEGGTKSAYDGDVTELLQPFRL